MKYKHIYRQYNLFTLSEQEFQERCNVKCKQTCEKQLRVRNGIPLRNLVMVFDGKDGKLRTINPFPNKPWFLRVCSINLLKTIFHIVFYPLQKFLPFSFDLKLSSANSFSLEESKICRLGKG